MDVALYVLAGVAGGLALGFVVLALLAGGRLGLAWQAYRRVGQDAAFAGKVRDLLGGTAAAEPPKGPPKLSGEPLRLLTLLQREGRVLDFFLEDITGAPDELVGAGVREVHKKAQAVLKEHLVLEPIMAQDEDSTVEVPAGFNPAAVRLTGNVTGQPPFRGTLKHRGWRVRDYRLPAPEGQDELVVAPAEVDIP